MGKYMRKSKTATLDDKAAAFVDLGVRTRAKTLALQRLHNSAGSTLPFTAAATGASYLQLRSRRLQKPWANTESRRQNHLSKQSHGPNPNPSLIANPNSPPSLKCTGAVDEDIEESDDLAVEASFGENVLEFEGRGSSTRESTPCSLIKKEDSISTPPPTPGSSNKRSSNSDSDSDSSADANKTTLAPTSKDIDDFFTAAEQQQHKQFMDKYNFDPAKDMPLSGRYEWVKVNP